MCVLSPTRMVVLVHTEVAPTPPSERQSRWTLVVLGVLAGELVVLLLTGVWLYFEYRPSVRQAFGGLVGDDPAFFALADRVRISHRLVSWLTLPTAVAAGAMVVRTRRSLPRWRVPALGTGLVVLTVAAQLTGYMLPWDQLALRAVTVGSNLDGFEILLGNEVRFAILGGTEISGSTLVRWLVVHGLLLSPAMAILTVVAWRRVRPGAPDRT